jgi:hypothetical protein
VAGPFSRQYQGGQNRHVGLGFCCFPIKKRSTGRPGPGPGRSGRKFGIRWRYFWGWVWFRSYFNNNSFVLLVLGRATPLGAWLIGFRPSSGSTSAIISSCCRSSAVSRSCERGHLSSISSVVSTTISLIHGLLNWVYNTCLRPRPKTWIDRARPGEIVAGGTSLRQSLVREIVINLI